MLRDTCRAGTGIYYYLRAFRFPFDDLGASGGLVNPFLRTSRGDEDRVVAIACGSPRWANGREAIEASGAGSTWYR